MNKKYIVLFLVVLSVVIIYIVQGSTESNDIYACQQYFSGPDGGYYTPCVYGLGTGSGSSGTTPAIPATPGTATTPTVPATSATHSRPATPVAASPESIVEQYIVYSQASYRGTAKQVTLKDQSLTSVPSIFQYSIYNNDVGGSGGTLCTFYPGNSNQYEYIMSTKYNYNGSTSDISCN